MILKTGATNVLAKLIFQNHTNQNQDFSRNNNLFQDFYRAEVFFTIFQDFSGHMGTLISVFTLRQINSAAATMQQC